MKEPKLKERLNDYEIEITEHGIYLKNVEPLTCLHIPPENDDEAGEWWRVARARLFQRHPFFGFLLSRVKFSEEHWLPAPAATDGASFKYNPGLMPIMDNPKETLFVLAHEIIHIAFRHADRGHGKDPQVWNIACDLVTNTLLEKTFGFCPPNVVRDDDGEFDGMSVEGVYDIIYERHRQQQKENGQCQACGGSGKMASSSSSDSDGSDGEEESQSNGKCPACGGDGDSQDAEDEMRQQYGGKRRLDDHNPWEDAKNQSSEERRQREKDWNQAVSVAASIAKDRGNIPAGLERMVDDLFKIDLPWGTHVQRWLHRKVRAPKSTWSRPNRRHLTHGTIMPGRAKQQTGDLLVGVDTSGSMSDRELRYVISSIMDLAKSIPNLTMDVVALDTEIARDSNGEPIRAQLKPGDPVEPFIKSASQVLRGGGGTRMRPLFELAREEGPYDAVICCTDGYNDWGEFKFTSAPTLWLVTTEEMQAPWGHTVHIDEETLRTQGAVDQN